ncbi:MAG: hypothetical protein IKZ62_00530 [Prevotella sp.]|nr:hypothetical protein [Prevotella sp.]
MKSTWRYVVMLLAVLLPTACSTIDDDLSDCDNDFELDYEMRLVTNITTELNTQLSTAADVNVANALRSHLEEIFTDYARDIDLSFYDTEKPQDRLSHDQHVMNASEKSYTLYLPMREYMHLAVANIKDNSVVNLTGDDRCPTSRLAIVSTGDDIIDSHTTGLFTARQSMKVLEGVDQTFHVQLYMANCAEALVINPRGQKYKDIKVYATGFATQFNINDSIYSFSEKSPIVRTQQLDTQGGNLCFCAVNFPSSEEGMRTVVETDFDDGASDKTYWQFLVYVTLEDGTVTETKLSIRKKLSAGELIIINGFMGDKGDIFTDNTEVGVTVTLDWQEGGKHDIGI